MSQNRGGENHPESLCFSASAKMEGSLFSFSLIAFTFQSKTIACEISCRAVLSVLQLWGHVNPHPKGPGLELEPNITMGRVGLLQREKCFFGRAYRLRINDLSSSWVTHVDGPWKHKMNSQQSKIHESIMNTYCYSLYWIIKRGANVFVF